MIAQSSYIPAFKSKAINEFHQIENKSALAKKLGISRNTLYLWVSESEVQSKVAKLSKFQRNFDVHHELTSAELIFCNQYVMGVSRFNSYEAYITAFQLTAETPDEKKTIEKLVQDLLSDIRIISHINKLMIKNVSVTNEMVDAVLFGMISQNDDFGLKLQALKIYYKKSGRLEGREKIAG